jgi:hypothetical protein
VSEVAQDLLRGVVSGNAGDAATGMRAGAAHVESGERSAIVRKPEHRPRAEQLVECQRAVKDIAADETESAFQVEWRQSDGADDAGFEVRRVRIDRVDDQARRVRLRCVPVPAIGQLVAEMLAEAASM